MFLRRSIRFCSASRAVLVCRFSDLFGAAASRIEVVVTFLALLELIRLKQVRAIQKNVFEEIEIAAA